MYDFLLHLSPRAAVRLRIRRGSLGLDMAPTSGQPVWPARYTLYGVLYADRLSVNDETVSMLRHEDVFGRHEDERVDDQCDQLFKLSSDCFSTNT